MARALMLSGVLGLLVGASSASTVDQRLYDLAQEGRYLAAERLLDTSAKSLPADSVTALRIRVLLERRAWKDVSRTVDGSSGHTAAYAVGLAAARLSVSDPAAASMDIAQRMHSQLDQLAERTGRRSIVEVERLSVQAAIAAAQEEREEMALLLAHAIDLEGELSDGQIPILPIPVMELAGDLWFDVDRERDACREYAAALRRFPQRARSLLGLARASAAAGDRALAIDAYRILAALWTRADGPRIELTEAATYLGFVRR